VVHIDRDSKTELVSISLEAELASISVPDY
jgi:hypothetical protein